MLAANLVAVVRTEAVPACPTPVTFEQPDGTKIRVCLKGNEFHHWQEDTAGFTIVREAQTGRWMHAVPDGKGGLLASASAVGRDEPSKLGVPRHLVATAAAARAAAMASGRQSQSSLRDSPLKAPKVGTMKNLVVLVQFSDLAGTRTRPEYEALFNTIGYNTDGATGSVKDYYLEVSYNALTVESVVAEWVTLDHDFAYYGANDAYGNDIRPREMVQEALAKLEARGFDFSTVDGDNDGWIDGLTIIHAGGGEEYSGNNADYIWSHEWAMTSPLTYDGKSMRYYHTEPERRGWDSAPTSWGITRIGVICHETGHFLGLPDLYDYGYDSKGAGEFCLMAGGSWNGDSGTSPAHMSAWCKKTLGWLTPIVVSAGATFTAPRVEDTATAYQLNGLFPATQYFLIENRQGYGFDAGLPGSTRGLLLWHIDETQPDNDDQTHYLVDLEEASGRQHLELNENSGEDSDYYRGGGSTVFSATSTPNNLSYAGAPLGLDITSVSASGQSMTFTVAKVLPLPAPVLTAEPAVTPGTENTVAWGALPTAPQGITLNRSGSRALLASSVKPVSEARTSIRPSLAGTRSRAMDRTPARPASVTRPDISAHRSAVPPTIPLGRAANTGPERVTKAAGQPRPALAEARLPASTFSRSAGNALASATEAPGPLGAPRDIFTETFESGLPGSWTIAGDPTWGGTGADYHNGSKSAWCAASSVDPVNGYGDNMLAWLVYGPFSLADATSASVSFWYRNSSQPDHDYFGWYASTNGSGFSGYHLSGDQNTWRSEIFDLANVPTLGNLCGESQVWIAFIFQSDGSVSGPTYTGAFVDDVTIQTDDQALPADLTAYEPESWNDRIPIGPSQLTDVDNHPYSGQYYDNQTLYFNWAAANQGGTAAAGYTVHAQVTGTGGGTWDWSGLNTDPGYYISLATDQAVGPLAEGTHTFKLWLDYNANVTESDEANNYYERTITVASGLIEYYAECADNSSFLSPTGSGWTTQTHWTFSTLTRGQTYWFRVKARRAGDETDWSNVAHSQQAINQAPSFVKGSNQTCDQNAGLVTLAGWATAISPGSTDESDQTVDFLVTNNKNYLFAVQPAADAAGTLTYTTTLNLRGTATVTIRLHDDAGTDNGGEDTSAAQTFQIIIGSSADTDGDGLPDDWEAAYGLSGHSPDYTSALDTDGDGIPDGEEFLAGTNPAGASDFLRICGVEPGSGSECISVTTVMGKVYRLERDDAFPSESWTQVGADVTGNGGVLTFPDPDAASLQQRIYRVRVIE